MILDIMESKIREQTIEMQHGKPVVVDVVPSIKERREADKLVLAYTWGLPVHLGHDELERRVIELERQLAERPTQSWPH